MTANVLVPRPIPSHASIASGALVRSRTWLDTAQLTNWVRGHGAVLVPATCPLETITSGTQVVYRFQTNPTLVARRRVWLIGLRASTATGPSHVEVRAPSTAGAIIVTADVGTLAINPICGDRTAVEPHHGHAGAHGFRQAD
jgi:hypothetical protein